MAWQSSATREEFEVNNRSLIAAGAFGALLAAICCATPLLAVLLGAIGLTTWLAKADYVLVPALLLCLAILGIGHYRLARRRSATSSVEE